MRRLLACLLIWLGGAAFADTGCLRAVEGGHFGTESGGVDKACISSAIFATIPGYPRLMIQRDACPFLTLTEGRLASPDGPYPHSALWAYRDFDVADDGTVYGYGGAVPRRVYQLGAGESQFKALPIEGYRGVQYDARSDKILLRYDDRPLQEWSESEGESLSSLAGLSYGRNDILPQYFEALKGYLSFSDNRLYWRAEAGGDWQRLRLGWFDRHVPNDIWMLLPERSYVDAASGLFMLQFSNEVLVFDVSDGGKPRFLYAVRDAQEVFQVGHGSVVVVIGAMLLTEKRTQHTIRVIERNGPRRVRPGDAVAEETVKRLAVPRNGALHSGYIGPPLFHVSGTWMFFDGEQFFGAPELGADRTGPYPRWTYWGERLFLLDQRGWWEVQRDLTLTPGELPISYEWIFEVEIDVSETFGAIFASHSEQGLWVSRDGLTFAQIDTGDVPVRRYVTDLPKGGDGVVLAEDGLYLIDGACVDAAFR